jgi:hypothetical protein
MQFHAANQWRVVAGNNESLEVRSGVVNVDSLEIQGTDVISSSRQLQNIASVDATTKSVIITANAPEVTVYSGTTTSASNTINPNSTINGTVLYETGTIAAGTYTLDNLGDNSPYWSKGSNTYATFAGQTSFYAGGNYMGQGVGYYVYYGGNYYTIWGTHTLNGSGADLMNSLITYGLNSDANGPNQEFTVSSSFTIRIMLGAYGMPSTFNMSSAVTNFGGAGTYRLNSGVSFGFRLTKKAASTETTGSGTQYP